MGGPRKAEKRQQEIVRGARQNLHLAAEVKQIGAGEFLDKKSLHSDFAAGGAMNPREHLTIGAFANALPHLEIVGRDQKINEIAEYLADCGVGAVAVGVIDPN
jgi:hypothetical protein